MIDTCNRRLIGRIWEYNALPREYRPRLQYGSLQTPDLGTLGSFVQAISGAGAELFPNPDLTDALLRQANLPITSKKV